MKIYKNKAGKYCIDFTRNKRRIRRVIGYKKREAEDALAKIQDDIVTGKYRSLKKQDHVLFRDFANEYLENYSRPNKRSSVRDEASIKSLMVFFEESMLHDIGPEDAERFKAARRADVAAATVNRELACLKGIFSKAEEWGRIDRNPISKVKKFKEPPGKERILSPEESSRLIAEASPRLKPIIVVLLGTGMRKGEALSLRWDAVDLEKGFIYIQDSKSGKSRNIPITSAVHITLSELRAKSKSELVFPSYVTGEKLVDFKKSFAGACSRAGIKGVRIHDLRHTAATRMVEAGIDLVTVSKILGHSSIQMTMRYAHPTPENMRRAVDALGAFLEEKTRHKVVNDYKLESVNDSVN